MSVKVVKWLAVCDFCNEDGPEMRDSRTEAEVDERECPCRDEEPTCGGPVGSPPWWMNKDQFDPCRCLLPRGHDGECQCEHTGAQP